MLRTTILKSSTTTLLRPSTTLLLTRPYSVIEKTKLALSWANHAVGKMAAKDIEIAEHVAQTTAHGVKVAEEDLKIAAEFVNKQGGRVLADGIEIGEKVAHGAEEAVHFAEEEVELLNLATGRIIADGIEIAQIVKHRHDAIAKVRQNKRGYASLQDKGSKVESEQNRPDDGL